ncbi:glycerophosphoinositol permease [Metarhizium acridum]|nr:glycerophosphoinositol permease [Metarhizium acridum]
MNDTNRQTASWYSEFSLICSYNNNVSGATRVPGSCSGLFRLRQSPHHSKSTMSNLNGEKIEDSRGQENGQKPAIRTALERKSFFQAALPVLLAAQDCSLTAALITYASLKEQ